MALDPNLPQPPEDERLCRECGRPCLHPNDAMLYHCGADTSPIFTGVAPVAFSMWLYRCKWCRMNDTKALPVPVMEDELWAFIDTMQDDVVPPYVKSCVPRTKRERVLARQLVIRGLGRWVSQWPLEEDALYLTVKGYERMGWDARFVVEE